MTPRAGVYAHPVDLDDLRQRGGLSALRDLGFSEVSLAAAYHAGRWLTPQSTAGRVRFLEDGVVHFRPGADYGVLRPQASSEVLASGVSPFERFVEDCKAAGLRSCAWTVLFHNTRLGEMHPGLCVCNAFGDRYVYALCPAQAEVVEYGVRLVADLAGYDVATIELEAAGFMGHKHGSHHDKSSFAGDRALDFLLSFCFCEACASSLRAHGVDPDDARARFASLIQLRLGDAMQGAPSSRPLQQVVEEIGEQRCRALLAHRQDVNRRFLQAARQAAGSAALALHVEPDPFFTGSQMGQPFAAVGDLVDEIVVTHYGMGPEQIASAWAGQQIAGLTVHGALWPKAPQFTRDEDVRAAVEALVNTGCAGVRVYHLGLLPWRTIERVAAMLATG